MKSLIVLSYVATFVVGGIFGPYLKNKAANGLIKALDWLELKVAKIK